MEKAPKRPMAAIACSMVRECSPSGWCGRSLPLLQHAVVPILLQSISKFVELYRTPRCWNAVAIELVGTAWRAWPSVIPEPVANLFSRDVQVAVLSSGSRGNSTYIGDGRSGVLIDCGLSTKQILLRMQELGLEDAPIDAVLVTHEHSDHAGACRILSNRLAKLRGERVPF